MRPGELGTSKEELQSVNEELTMLNEELRLKLEELRSVNEELTTVNQELRRKVDELSRANSDLQHVTDLRDAHAARRRSEAAQHVAEERLRIALRGAPVVVLMLDPGGRATWGYAHGRELDARGLRMTGMFLPHDSDRFASITRRVLETRSGARAELEVRVGDAVHTYDFRFEPNGAGATAVGFDITPSKRAEAALLDADRRKDEFLATLSHELRNPLTPLRVALDVAKLRPDDPVKVSHSRAIMERQVDTLTLLVDELLDLSRITQGKIELELVVLDPAEIIEGALEATQPLIAQARHELAVDLPLGDVRVLGDRMRLVQVMTNLVSNAAKFTPEGGHIRISVAPDHARKVVALRVRDDGIGIEPELLPRIFEIFVQSRDASGRVRGGLGIGLNVVRRIVELHGGTATASSPGKDGGSEFVVELPLVEV